MIAAVALSMGACGGAADKDSSPEVVGSASVTDARLLPIAALKRLTSTTSVLNAREFARELPMAGLEHPLGGFRGATQREFVGRGQALTHVVSRTAAFADSAGAAEYASQVETGVLEYFGPGTTGRSSDLGGARGSVVRPGACGCRPEVPETIAIFTRGSRVIWLSISGPGATAQLLAKLVDRL